MTKLGFFPSFAVALVAVAGCASTPKTSADQVRVTSEPVNVSGCRAVGSPNGLPPQASTGEIMRSLKIQAAGAGGNVVYLDSDRPPYRGTIYHCDPGSLPRRGQ